MADLPKPVAQVQRMGSYQGVPAYGCLLTIEAEKRLKVNDPLFGLAELEAYAAAKVAEEREKHKRDVEKLRRALGDIAEYAHKTDDVRRWCAEALSEKGYE